MNSKRYKINAIYLIEPLLILQNIRNHTNTDVKCTILIGICVCARVIA